MKAKVLEKYHEVCEKSKHVPAKQVSEYLQGEDDIASDGESVLLMIYPGNITDNFNSRLKDDDIQPIAIAYMTCITKLKILNLSHNKITDRGLSIISKLLEFAENIEDINFESNQIGDSGCEKLSSALKGKVHFKELNLNGNLIGNQGIMHINELLFTNQGLIKLNMGNNRYDWDGIISVTTALSKANSTLQVLNLDDPMYKIQDQYFFSHFGKMFLSNTGLKKISLKFHKLRFEGINILSYNLKHNETLTVLDLSCNQICFQGVKYLSEYLKINSSLKSVILANNKIKDQGAKLFAQGIAVNDTITHVDLTSNQIEDEGLQRLAEAFIENRSVRSLKIFWNNKWNNESIKLFQNLTKQRGSSFYPDFVIYDDITGDTNIAYLETHIPDEEEYLVQ